MPPPLGRKPSKDTLFIFYFFLFLDTLFRMEWYKPMSSWWPTRTWSLGPLGLFCSPRITLFYTFFGLPWWPRWKRICLQCRRPEFDPWVRKIPWRREWQPTPVFLPGEFHGQRSSHNWATKQRQFYRINQKGKLTKKKNSFESWLIVFLYEMYTL